MILRGRVHDYVGERFIIFSSNGICNILRDFQHL